jgi:hypothetical protein
MDRRINPHRGFVGIFVRDIQVHVERVAVPFPNSALPESANRVGEIKINSQTARANAAPLVTNLLRVESGEAMDNKELP